MPRNRLVSPVSFRPTLAALIASAAFVVGADGSDGASSPPSLSPITAPLSPLVDQRAYVPSFLGGTIAVVDISGEIPLLVETIAVGGGPLAVALDRFGELMLVSNHQDSTVALVHLGAPQHNVVTTVPVGAGPVGVDFDPSGTRASVVNFEDATVSVIDLLASPPHVIATLPVGTEPEQMVYSPDGQTLYVSDSFDNFGRSPSPVWRVDLSVTPPQVDLAFLAGPEAHGMDISEDGARLYVVSSEDDALRVVDLTVEPPAVVDTIEVGERPFLVAVRNDRAFVTLDDNSVAVVDLGTLPGTVLTTTAVGEFPRGIDVAYPGGRVFVVEAVPGTLSTLEPKLDYELGSTIAVGEFPIAAGRFLAPTPSTIVFSDGFESGGTARWNTAGAIGGH